MSIFNKVTYAIGSKLGAAFNKATGNTALKNKGLEREPLGATFAVCGGSFGGIGTGVVTALLLAPIMGPLAAIPAVAAGVAALCTPARLNASYILGKNSQ